MGKEWVRRVRRVRIEGAAKVRRTDLRIATKIGKNLVHDFVQSGITVCCSGRFVGSVRFGTSGMISFI